MKYLSQPVLFALIMLSAGCGGGGGGGDGGGGGGAPLVAIYNASFETLGANPDGNQPDGWIREGVNDWSLSGLGVKRVTGSGFMPTDGQYFLNFPSSDAGTPLFPGNYPYLKIYQDNVNLSGATSLVFDYEVTNRNICTGSVPYGYDGSAVVRIFFQPNSGGGTVDLWLANYGPGTGGEQVSGKTVPLSSLSDGRLTIEVSTNPCLQGSLVVKSTLTFRIDRIRVQ